MGENKFNNFEHSQSKNSPEEELDANEVLKLIEGIIKECSVMGANDSELPELEKIKGALLDKKISAAEAQKMATRIRESKQDYH